MNQIKEFNIRSIYDLCLEKEYIISSLTYNEFNKIVRDFNKEIADKILKGYKFQPGFRLGLFNIVRDIRRGQTIDWGASNKLKKEILAKGEILYDKEKNPEGKEWLLYYLDNEYFKWKWSKIGTAKYTPNILFFMFRASSRNRRIIGKIVREDKSIIDNYGEYKQVSIL